MLLKYLFHYVMKYGIAKQFWVLLINKIFKNIKHAGKEFWKKSLRGKLFSTFL